MNSIDIWWIAVVLWAAGFTVSMITRLRYPWAPVCYEVGCVLLIVSAYTDPKIDSPTAGLITAILGLCMVGIGIGAKEMHRHHEGEKEVNERAEQEVE